MKDPLLFSYHQEVQSKISQFVAVEVKKIRRDLNVKADTLFKMATIEEELKVEIMYEIRTSLSIPR